MIGRRRTPSFLLILTLLAGCGLPGFGDDELDELKDAQRRWQRAGPASYSYVLSRQCFCPPEVYSPVRITVENRVRTSVVYAETGQPVSAQYLSLFPTVDTLFIELVAAFRRADVARGEYHAVDGHPLHISIDFHRNAIDDELGFVVNSLTHH